MLTAQGPRLETRVYGLIWSDIDIDIGKIKTARIALSKHREYQIHTETHLTYSQ